MIRKRSSIKSGKESHFSSEHGPTILRRQRAAAGIILVQSPPGIADDGDEEIEQMLRAAPNDAGYGALLGRFAQAHREYLKESLKSLYASLRASGQLGSCLADLDHQAKEMHDRLCAQMALQEGVTEQLKAADQLEWLRRMENIRNRADEIVNANLIFT